MYDFDVALLFALTYTADMEPRTMSMDAEFSTREKLPASGRLSLPRFPSRWAVGSVWAEGFLARLLWLLVPLQYLVLTNLPRALSGDDVIPAVALSLMSVAVIFVLSYGIALLVSVTRQQSPQHEILSARVRMWVVALMIGTAAAYLLLALSLVAGKTIAYWRGFNIYYDPVTVGLRWLTKPLQLIPETLATLLPWFQALSNLVYAYLALLMIMLAHRLLRRGKPRLPNLQEPDMISVGLIVAAVMSATHYVATLD